MKREIKVGEIISDLRKTNKLTQAQLADKVNISVRHLGRLERGRIK